jgi:hypothetical protein
MFLVMLATALGVAGAQPYERPPAVRQASAILPAAGLTGPHYRIMDKVVTFGYQHRFTVTSDFGVFEVTGDAALRKLLREIHAIAEIQKLKGGKEFAKAVGNAALSPVYFSKDLITDPVDTVTGIPKGVFRLFKNAGTAITTKRDPETDSKIQTILLVSKNKRDYAAKLGVDVYSSNKVLQKELNSLGWAAAAGSWAVTIAAAPFSGPGMMAFKATRFSNSMNTVLQQEPPPRLRQINSKKLGEMGVSDDLKKRFLDHSVLSPRHKTVIVHSLSELSKASGQGQFISLALSAEDEVDANFFMQMAETLRGYDETVSPLVDIMVVPPMVLAKTAKGPVLMPFPLDQGVWTERAAHVVPQVIGNARVAGFTGPYELWVTGTLSAMARQQLSKLGITATENVDERLTFMD